MFFRVLPCAAAAVILTGCGAAPDSTSLLQSADRSLGLDVDRGFEEIPAELGDLPPVWEGSPEMFPLEPVEQQYHGGYALEGYGVEHGGRRYLQDGGETTWAPRAGSEPTRFQLGNARAAFERLGHLLPNNWTFVELASPNAQTDIVIDFRDNANVPEGCFGPGTCWFGSASCKSLADVQTGVAGLHVCEQFGIDVAVNNIETFIAAYDAHPQLTWQAFFLHEIGHTLGLNHAAKSSQSIMRPSLWVPGAATTELHTYSCRELERLRGYLPMPGAWAPLEVIPTNPENCQ